MSDKWLFGFITLWIVLTAGKPDLLDAIAERVSGKYSCQTGGETKCQLKH